MLLSLVLTMLHFAKVCYATQKVTLEIAVAEALSFEEAEQHVQGISNKDDETINLVKHESKNIN